MQQISRAILRPPLIPTCAVTLLLASILALVGHPTFDTSITLALILVGGYLMWWIIGYTLKSVWGAKKSLGDLIISLLILFLVWQTPSQANDYLFLGFAIAVTVLAKYFLYYRSVSLVNPAVAGMLAATLAVALYESMSGVITWGFISWHGMTSSPILLVLMVTWAMWGAIRMKKYALIGSYIVVFTIWQFLLGGMTGIESYFSSIANLTTILLLATVMLVEPRTAPPLPWQQLAYGALSAVCVLTINTFHIPGWEVLALAVMNILYAIYRIEKLPKIKNA